MGRVAGDKEGEWQLMSTGLLSRVMKMFWVSKLKKKKKLELYALKCRPQWYVNYMSIFMKILTLSTRSQSQRIIYCDL